MGKLDGKVAVITGGASGIGKASVRLFIEQGCRVVIADIQDQAGGQLAEALGESAVFVHTDVSQEAEVKAAIDFAMRRFGRLDCMFNNAGVPGGSAKIEETTLADFERIMSVHLRGVFLGMKHAAPVMKRQGSGSIISTASVAGMATGYSSHIYSAAKAAIIHLTRSVAMELGESMVRVNCICPGGIATPNFGRAAGLSQEAAEQISELIRPAFATMQPIRRAGLPEDVAQAALWLASDDSSFVNGHALVVDGGMSGGRQWSAYQEQVGQLSAFLRQASRES